jgi:hypothetical protein
VLDALEDARYAVARAVERRAEAGFPAAMSDRRECWARPGHFDLVWRRGMEACANRASLAREWRARTRGAADTAGPVRRLASSANNNDAADAKAICEAVTPATMRFVPNQVDRAQSVLTLLDRATGVCGSAPNR